MHADLVFLLLGLSVGFLVGAGRAAAAPRPVAVRAAAEALIGIELAQGLIGFMQCLKRAAGGAGGHAHAGRRADHRVHRAARSWSVRGPASELPLMTRRPPYDTAARSRPAR